MAPSTAIVPVGGRGGTEALLPSLAPDFGGAARSLAGRTALQTLHGISPRAPGAARTPRRGDGLAAARATPAPLWFGGQVALRAEGEEHDVEPASILELVPEDMAGDPVVQEICRLEVGAMELEQGGWYGDAAEKLLEASELRRSFLGEAHPEASRAVERYVLLCNRWGARSVALGQRVQALALLKAAESMTEPGAAPLEPPRRMALRAATFAEMCGYFRACEKLHAAMQYAKKAVSLEQHVARSALPTPMAMNYASLLIAAGRHDEALGRLGAAVAALEREEHRAPSALVVALYNAWVAQCHLGRARAGVEALRQAAGVAQRRLGDEHPLSLKVEQALASTGSRDIPMLALHSPATSARQSRSSRHSGSNLSSRYAATSAMAWWPLNDPLKPKVTLRGAAHSKGSPARAEMMESRPGQGCQAALAGRLQQISLKETLYGREVHHIRAGAAGPLFGEHRARIAEEAQFPTGSAMTEQQAYGVQPQSVLAEHRAADRKEAIAPDAGRLRAIDRLPRAGRSDLVRVATRIQAAWRGYVVRRWSVAASAGFPRGLHGADSSRRLALELVGVARGALVEHHAAVAIQRLWRGALARRFIDAELSRMAHGSASQLQAAIRARRRQHGPSAETFADGGGSTAATAF